MLLLYSSAHATDGSTDVSHVASDRGSRHSLLVPSTLERWWRVFVDWFSLKFLWRINNVLRPRSEEIVHSLISSLEAGRVECAVVNFGQDLGRF